ncbi:hypothetical protein [Paracidovorax avenae]|uniref:hypothetical protein n=1 Tax=Paracidovorax avenae TaxID=80867 RepID=UPI0012603BDE|nr:hypothetical protein [Paracidovorax avenae]
MTDAKQGTKVLATLEGVSINLEWTTTDAGELIERVWFNAGATIDADGANGQFGGPVAYNNRDEGSDLLQNGGMMIRRGSGKPVQPGDQGQAVLDEHGQVVEKIVPGTGEVVEIPDKKAQAVLDKLGKIRIFEPGGVVRSPTSYRFPGTNPEDLNAYVDAETVPYVVVFEAIIKGTKGKVMGCRARLSYNGSAVDCVVADASSGERAGEISIAAARALGIRHSPRNGGIPGHEILYEIWPGQPVEGFPWMKH